MRKIVVKLTERVIKIDKSQAVLTVNVVLEPTANGDSAISSTAQPAIITFSVREKADGPSTLLGTLTSTIIQSGKNPQLDLNAATFKNVLKESDTDNSVELTFDKKTFAHPKTGDLTFTLRLPDAPQAFSIRGAGAAGDVKVGKFEIGAALTISGKAEAPGFADVAHVHLRHEQVKDDTEPSTRDLCIGATLVHPTDLRVQGVAFPPPPTRRLPIGSDRLEILLHPTVRGRIDALISTNQPTFKIDSLGAKLGIIFTDVFPRMSIEVVPSGDPRLTPWTQVDSRLVSKSLKDPNDPKVDEGHLVPFFQFWFFASRDTGTGELGSAEVLAAPQFFFSAKTKQKRIQRPADLPLGDGSPFRNEYKGAKDDEARMTLLANVIAHEVGHALGLLHVRKATPSGYELPTSSALMAQLVSGLTQFAPAAALKRLHPVHEAVLRHHYG